MSASVELLERRCLLSVTAMERPSFNTGTGFFVDNGVVYDANGAEFDIRGFNHTHWWGDAANNLAAVDEFAKTGANAVRVVMGTGSWSGSDTPAQRREIVERYIDNEIVPIVEDHMATCDTTPGTLLDVVDRWLEPDNVAWLRQYEREIILNIANEWGPDSPAYRDTYTTAITRLRDAGINAMLMIDAGGCGQNIHTLQTWAQQLLDHDPQKNIVFSIHMYNMWRTEEKASEVGTWDPAIGSPWDVATELAEVKAAGIPIIVGEFSWDGTSFVGYDTERAVQIFDDLDLGWLAWSWNQNSDPLLDMIAGGSNWQYNSDADLTPFGDFIINDPDVGLKATGIPATIWDSQSAAPSTIHLENAAYGGAEGQTISVEVRRSGSTAATVQVTYATADGTATAGEDYEPRSGVLTFAPGESVKLVTIPLLRDGDPTEGVEQFRLVLSDVVGPSASLEAPFEAVITVTDLDDLSPTITSVSLESDRRRLTGITLHFSEPMRESAVEDPSAYSLYFHGIDGRLGHQDPSRAKQTAIGSATYDSQARSVTLRPEKPLKRNRLYEVFAQSTRLIGSDGNQLDGNGDGRGGDVFRQFVGNGTKFKFLDPDDDIVQLRLKGGGSMDLFRSRIGAPLGLDVVGAGERTTLVGRVTQRGSGVVYIRAINGLAWEALRLREGQFRFDIPAPPAVV